jgi:glycosyltransferase involved in cell wall biosynthesis
MPNIESPVDLSSPSDNLHNEELQGLARTALPGVVLAPIPEARDVYRKHYDYDPETGGGSLEVFIESTVTLKDIESVTPEKDMELLHRYAKENEGKKIVRINATPAGGGVAIMNAPWVHTMNLLGVDAHWYAMKPNTEASKVTKWKFHNILQNVAGEGVVLTEDDMALYDEWVAENAEILAPVLEEADTIIIDDWQPSGLIPYIKGYTEETPDGPVYHMGINPNATILFRDHIHTEGELMVAEGTPQNITWDFLWEHNRIKDADVFITHPKDEFVPPNVPNEKVVFMPATCDYLDDLNRPLTEEEVAMGFAFINERLALNENQSPIDLNRPYFVLVARFDESKGMPQGMEAYAKARQELLDMGASEDELPQLVILGNGSVDDPSGEMILEEIMHLRSETYADIKDDLKIARVPHNDMAINALIGKAKLALQPSIREGFESRVTDAILQGVMVIGSDQGGIPLQIVEGQSGFIENPYNTDAWAHHMVTLMTNNEAYENMRKLTLELAKSKNYAFTTVPNVIRWLWLSSHAKDDAFIGERKWVDELVAKSESDLEESVTAGSPA